MDQLGIGGPAALSPSPARGIPGHKIKSSHEGSPLVSSPAHALSLQAGSGSYYCLCVWLSAPGSAHEHSTLAGQRRMRFRSSGAQGKHENCMDFPSMQSPREVLGTHPASSSHGLTSWSEMASVALMVFNLAAAACGEEASDSTVLHPALTARADCFQPRVWLSVTSQDSNRWGF